MNNSYTGYQYFNLTEQELAKFYADKNFLLNKLQENEYGILKFNGNIVEKVKKQNNYIDIVHFQTIDTKFGGKTKPRNIEQELAVDMLHDQDSTVKLITGTFGTGKSLLCIAAALEAIEKGKFEKIVFIRNNVQVRDTDSLGALPGSEFDKTLPYVMPLADHCGGIEGIKYLIEEGKLEVIPLGFLRGRSIRNSILYSMESENLTKQHIQLILGRIDEGSQLWMDGDIRQRDRVAFEKSQGLEILVERLQGNPLFGYIHLLKTERSETAALADLLD